jgi:predicted Fe-Mo cluster-binding NifX family protein
MKICFPTKGKEGLSAKLYSHFGSAPYFTIFDTDTKNIEIVDNGNKEHIHGACNPLETLKNSQIDAIVVGGIGFNAFKKLSTLNVRIYSHASTETVEAVYKAFLKNELIPVNEKNICSHGDNHSCQ